MPKYIDADILKQQDFQDFSNTDVMNAIDRCPAADVKPVVRGEWENKKHIIALDNVTLSGTYPTCNLCDYAEVGMTKNTNYCPNCGANMKGANP